MNSEARYRMELFDRSYHIRSDLDASKTEAVIRRLREEVRQIEKADAGLTNQEVLVLVALNLSEKLYELENENQYLTELLEHNGYADSD